MEKKNRAIILVTNSKMLFACGTIIMNIIEVMPEFDNIIVIYDDLSPEEAESLAKLDDRVKLIKYTVDDFCKEFALDKAKYINSWAYNRFTHLNTSKIRLFKYLSEYKQIIFLDTDILLKDDLGELLSQTEYDIIGTQVNTITGVFAFTGYDISKLPDNEFYRELRSIPIYNGGFFIANDNFDVPSFFEKGRAFLKLCFDRNYTGLLEEPSIGFAAYKFKLKVKSTDYNYNIPPQACNTSAKLIHFYGPYKPWWSPTAQMVFPDWLKYYKKFNSISGVSSPMVTEFSDIGWFMRREYFMCHFIPIINQVTLSNNIKTAMDFNSNSLYLIYNNLLYFKLELSILQESVSCALYVDKVIKSFNKDADEKWTDAISAFPHGKDISKENDLIFVFNRVRENTFPVHFKEIYNKIAPIRELCDSRPPSSLAKRGKLQTFLKTWLGYDGVRLVQTTNVDEALEVLLWGDIAAFKLPGEDRYIRFIAESGLVELGEKAELFKALHDKDKIAIEIRHQYLSARNDQKSVIIASKCSESERFDFIPRHQLAQGWRNQMETQ